MGQGPMVCLRSGRASLLLSRSQDHSKDDEGADPCNSHLSLTGSTFSSVFLAPRSQSVEKSIASATGFTKMKLTGIITQKVSGHEADDRYSFLQFMTDCVVLVRHQVVDGSAFRNLRIVKYRGSGFFLRSSVRAGLPLAAVGYREVEFPAFACYLTFGGRW